MTEGAVVWRRGWRSGLDILRAFAPGALVGLVTILAERIWLGLSPALTAAAVYCLAGGALSTLGWLVGRLVGPPAVARMLSGIGASALPIGFLVYLVNVRLLPGEPFTSLESLAADIAAVALCVTVALALLWLTRRVVQKRVVSATGAALAGMLLAASGAVVVGSARSAQAPVREGSGDASQPNLLLVMQDSVRRDHLGLHGYSRPTSPVLDRIARRARVFERAYAASSWTAPSVDWVLAPQDDAGTRLQERLASRGYRTACFTDNPHLTRHSEVLRGFDVVERSVGAWRFLFRSTVAGETLERLAPGDDERLVERALTWAEQEKGPVFLYAHLMDSHAPYDEPPIDGVSRSGRRIEFPVSGMELSTSEREDIVARYDGGVLSTDAQVGRLFEAMRTRGRPFLAILTSDHGESLGEQGRWYHGRSLAPELLAVHLVVSGSNVSAGRLRDPVGFSSVTKTLLAASGDPCEACPGIDLRRNEREAFVEGALPPDLLYRIEDGHKLIWDTSTRRAQLFDLESDPDELIDVAPDETERVASLSAKLGEARTLTPADPAAIERLRALGYVQDD